ncbi:hypothetical protein ACA910_005690 [Epithemia clementina (nom. ined.)]
MMIRLALSLFFLVHVIEADNNEHRARTRGLSSSTVHSTYHYNMYPLMKRRKMMRQYPDDPSTFSFTTRATGDQEVPEPVDTTTKAQLDLAVDAGFTAMVYDLSVYNGFGITAAHLHCAPPGTNGEVIAVLFTSDDADLGDTVNGRLSYGILTNADIINPNTICGTNIVSIFANIVDDNVYVNVHSVEFPDGLVRGQVGLFASTQ